MASRFLLGVDEAGRGPLAGPVAVGVVKVLKRFNFTKHFPDAADSKVLTEEKREEIYVRMQEFQKRGLLEFTVKLSSASQIDRLGMTKAVHLAIYKGVYALAPQSEEVLILLDGLLHAPPEFIQKTIIRGDATEPIISLASIAAKVERDQLMNRLAKKYSDYGFEKHKGYGTALHRLRIKEFGLSDVHRRTFIGRKARSDLAVKGE